MQPVDLDRHDAAQLPGHQMVMLAKDQPQYQPLPAAQIFGRRGKLVTRWALTDAERTRVSLGGDIYLTVLTFGEPLQPVMLTVGLDPQCPMDT